MIYYCTNTDFLDNYSTRVLTFIKLCQSRYIDNDVPKATTEVHQMVSGDNVLFISFRVGTQIGSTPPVLKQGEFIVPIGNIETLRLGTVEVV